jgi:hypothetical protein
VCPRESTGVECTVFISKTIDPFPWCAKTRPHAASETGIDAQGEHRRRRDHGRRAAKNQVCPLKCTGNIELARPPRTQSGPRVDATSRPGVHQVLLPSTRWISPHIRPPTGDAGAERGRDRSDARRRSARKGSRLPPARSWAQAPRRSVTDTRSTRGSSTAFPHRTRVLSAGRTSPHDAARKTKSERIGPRFRPILDPIRGQTGVSRPSWLET